MEEKRTEAELAALAAETFETEMNEERTCQDFEIECELEAARYFEERASRTERDDPRYAADNRSMFEGK